jgi:hypothetical protein
MVVEDKIYPSELILLHLFLGLPIYAAFFIATMVGERMWIKNTHHAGQFRQYSGNPGLLDDFRCLVFR